MKFQITKSKKKEIGFRKIFNTQINIEKTLGIGERSMPLCRVLRRGIENRLGTTIFRFTA